MLTTYTHWMGIDYSLGLKRPGRNVDHLHPSSAEVNTLRTGLLNCLNARSRGLTFGHRASSI